MKAYYSVRDPNGNDNKIIFYDQGQLASGIGCTREQIHFAELDGDGRPDYYLCVRRDSSVTGYRNLAYAANPGGINWVPYGLSLLYTHNVRKGNDVLIHSIRSRYCFRYWQAWGWHPLR